MKRIARNVFFSFVGFAWPTLLAFATTPLIVRGLGDASYGVWTLVGNIIGYLSILNSLQTAGTKYLAEYVAVQDTPNIQKLLSTSLIFNLAIGTIGASVIVVSAPFLATELFRIPATLQEQSIIAFRLAGLGLALIAITWWGASVLAGLQRYDLLMGVSLTMTTISVGGSLLALWREGGVIGVTLANIVSLFIAAVMYLVLARILLPEIRFSVSVDGVMFRRVFAFGMFSTLQVIFGLIATQMDRTFLGIFVGVSAVTLYSVPALIATRIHQLCAKTLEAVFPLSSQLGSQGQKERLQLLFIRAQNLNVVLVLAVSTPLIVLASPILRIWISPEFALSATSIFQYLVVAYGILALNVVAAAISSGLGQPQVNTGFALFFGLTNLVGYILLIPLYGAEGAAIGSAISSVVTVFPYLWYVNRRFIHLSWKEAIPTLFLRPILATVPAFAWLLILQSVITSLLTLMTVLGIGILIYLGMTVMLGVWLPSELMFARQLFTSVRKRLARFRIEAI